MSRESFLWHDYETFGTHPALDRPAQFAAQRTDANLQAVGEPLVLFCRPSDDMLPHPGACLVTGITPQQAAREGVVEAEFARRIHAEMMEPGTCGGGFNNLRFDDEFTRNIFYRNFIDPYEREWRNGNSRFDLIGLARMCYALRPEGITWPEHEPGVPSFRLEDLAAVNDIDHADAHDALADVRATIALARRLRNAQPRLFDWALGLRQQKEAFALLDPKRGEPVLHTSSRYPAARGCTALVLPLAIMPERPKSVIVVDLMADPAPLLELDAQDIADRVFTPAADLPDELERIPLKAVHSNKVPMLAPAAVLRDADPGRIGLDVARCERHAQAIIPHLQGLRPKLLEVFAPPPPAAGGDPDTLIYAGGFFSDADRAVMRKVRSTPPGDLGSREWRFADARLPEMLFRYRARNWPETLDAEERQRWGADRRTRLLQADVDGRLGRDAFLQALAQARHERADDGPALRVLDALEAWLLELRLDVT